VNTSVQWLFALADSNDNDVLLHSCSRLQSLISC